MTCFRAERRSGSGVDGTRLILRDAFCLWAGVKSVTGMGNGHVDEIQQRSIGAPLRKSSRLCEFFGDLDEMIDSCHRAVPLGSFVRCPPRQRGARFSAPRRQTRLFVGHSISPPIMARES
jgi:hypothetical protein